MRALFGRRASVPTLPMHPNVFLSGGERIMEGAFGLVTQSLMRLGTCTIEDLSRSPKADLEGIDLPIASSDFELLRASSQPPSDPGLAVADDKESQKIPSSMQFVAQLHQTCVGAFGNSEALKFEFLEETGQEDGKQCILTITRPNGQIRSYTTAPEFSRKSDAKARAAAIAVEMGAVDFILHGNKDISASKVILAPLDGSSAIKVEGGAKEESPVSDIMEDEASKEIEALCVEWRAGRVKPRWVTFKEHKASHPWGCALVIELSLHSQRLYSVEPRCDTGLLAKKACSETAIREGVVDFIKFGNGQTAPAPMEPDPFNETSKREPEVDRKGRTSAISLQSFFESLPKPFPEPIEDKPVANMNIPGILNTTLQLARGARLSMQFYFLNDNGLHGSILRLERPEEAKTFMADTRFMKRSDAKAAVCLQAMSQGIIKYIRSLAAAVDNKITPEMRRMANEQILPILGSEYGRLRFGMHPMYDYDHDNGAFGCTMTLSLCSSPKPGETKSWSVKPEYRTKTDAKIAVVCTAGAEAIEFVRFKGQPAPPGHDPFKPYRHKNTAEPRSGTDGLVRLGPQTAPLLETKEEAKARQMAASKWGHTEASASKSCRYQSAYSRNAPRSSQPASGLSRQYGFSRKGPAFPNASYKLASATDPSPRSLNPTHQHNQRQSPSTHQSQEYSQSTVDRLRPARASQIQRPPSQTSPPRQSPPPMSQAQQQYIQQPLTQNTSAQQLAPQQPPPQQSSPPVFSPASQAPTGSDAFSSYGTVPPLHQVIPPQAWPVPPPNYAQAPPPAYSYSVLQGTHYPPPLNGYAYPTTPGPPPPPPTYSVPSYPPYPAYFADPRYAQYPQYTVPGAPMPYVVPVAPAPGMQYTTPPPPVPGPVPTPSTPTNPAQMNTSLPTPPPTSVPDKSASAHWIEIDVSSIRAGSFSSENDRQKRPRSPRDMSMSPDDLQTNKKLRPESSSLQADAKRKSATPRSASKDSTPHVQQLLHYCETEGLSSPEFGAKQLKNERGEDAFKVWIVMGKERLELPVTFTSENEGRQRVAKQVLQRLKSHAAKK